MRAHIVGGGFGGLAAAAYLIRNAGIPGPDITVYEANARMGGSFVLAGDPKAGYVLPSGSVFDAQFRCTFNLLADIPSTENPSISVRDEFFAFNTTYPFDDRARLIDRNGRIVHGPRFGLSLRDGFDLARLALTPEPLLMGRRIDEFFSEKFFKGEFWLMYSTVMGSLPQHGATELRRYLNRTLHLFPALSDMTGILRTKVNQYESFIVPLVAWLKEKGVDLQNNVFVRDIGFADEPARITVNRLDFERGGTVTSAAIAPEDIVLLTFGSQATDLSIGSMDTPPRPRGNGRSWDLWRTLAQGRPEFGNPDAFFGAAHVHDSRWVSFTITTQGRAFIDAMEKLTGSETGRGGLVSLIDSNWMLSLSVFHHPEVVGQPDDTYLCWGYGLYPENKGDYIQKPMQECTGREILDELLRHLRFDGELGAAVKASTICIPSDLPYANNIWLPRKSTDRPRPVPLGSTNLGLIGQYVEMPRDVAFTIEYSARAAWEAIHILLQRGPAPPPVYQAQFDPKALFAALKVFVCPSTTRPLIRR